MSHKELCDAFMMFKNKMCMLTSNDHCTSNRIPLGVAMKLKKLKKKRAKEARKQNIHKQYTVYGYIEKSTGFFRYIGCTCLPYNRRYSHEKGLPNRYPLNSLSGRFGKGFKYHVFAKNVSRCTAYLLEEELIFENGNLLYNVKKGDVPSGCR